MRDGLGDSARAAGPRGAVVYDLAGANPSIDVTVARSGAKPFSVEVFSLAP